MHRKKPPKFTLYIFITAMAILSFLCLSLLLFNSPTSATTTTLRHRNIADSPPPPDLIGQACQASTNPQLCQSSLRGKAASSAVEVIESALSVSADTLRAAQSKAAAIRAAAAGNPNQTNAAENCLEHLGNSAFRIKSTADVLPRGEIKDGRAWTGAGLAYQYDCWSALKYVNTTQLIAETMSFLNDMLIPYTANALSMMMAYDIFGNEMASWRPPRTERDGFWESGGASAGAGEGQLGVPAGLKVDVTVCKGGCEYGTVQQAVDAAPSWAAAERRFVIMVKAGVYKEVVRVALEKRNVVLIGDGIGKTVITGNLNVGQPGISTYNTATVGVLGDGFMATDITFENTAGPDAHQAVAFRSDSDKSILQNCEFLGNQDTLYAHTLRQFYKSCIVQGNVDFIFGNAASVFHICTILIRPRQLKPEKGEKNAVTAHGRIHPAQSTGFVFHNCLVNGTEEYMKLYHRNPKVHKNFLGRPWKEFSRTVFIESKLEELISPEGWLPWTGDFALNTLYYGEFGNTDGGSDLSGRVRWSSRIPADRVGAYLIENFIQGDTWKLTFS